MKHDICFKEFRLLFILFYYLNIVLEGRDEACKVTELKTKKLLKAMLGTLKKAHGTSSQDKVYFKRITLKPFCCR